MIRLTALWMFVAVMTVYARRDWYVSLCGLIVMMAVIEHPDMPKTMFGIQGLNPWNLLLMAVVAGWLAARKREGLDWDMPRTVTVLLLLYLGVVVVAFARMMVDRAHLHDWTTASLVSEYFINRIKWVIPGLLLFVGCRTRQRFYMAVAAVLAVYALLGLYVIKWMPLGLLTSGDELERRALKILVNEIGYHRVNMSMMLAAASWAIFASRVLCRDWRQRAFMILAAAIVVYAQVLTGGRMGYVTWAAIGLVLCCIRDRALLAAAPVLVAALLVAVPAAGERMLEGFDSSTFDYATGRDPYELQRSGPELATVTAGRTRIWPFVQDKIAEAPVAGHGLLAMRRTGLVTLLAEDLDEAFEHPHNAYLELLLDNGVIGAIAILPFYALVLWRALRLYADTRSPVFVATGGVAAAFVLALLVAGMGSQTFYPREGAVGMWCAIGLLMRVWVQRSRVLGARAPQPAAQFAGGIVWPGPPRRESRPTVDRATAQAAAPSFDSDLWRAA